ncbi:MAG: CBS domain-containing protein [Desulfobacterales bacterium]|jgi:IMP dehydrogenase
MKVHELLPRISRPVYTLNGDQSVDDAINLMTAKKTSALIITEADHPVGIFAERDVFRAHIRDKAAAFSDILLKDAMTPKLLTAKMEDEVSAVMTMMIQADIKHMPVIKENEIAGLLTLADLIEHQINMLTEELRHLRDYIEDLHHAGQD